MCGTGDACIECGVADLCAPTWHPCKDGDDVSNHSATGCEDILRPGEIGFFLSLASASGNGVCGQGGRNDLHGCGNLGQPESAQCPPFTRRMGFADCQATSGVWSCGGPTANTNEADVVSKTSSDLGGVLCCKD